MCKIVKEDDWCFWAIASAWYAQTHSQFSVTFECIRMSRITEMAQHQFIAIIICRRNKVSKRKSLRISARNKQISIKCQSHRIILRCCKERGAVFDDYSKYILLILNYSIHIFICIKWMKKITYLKMQIKPNSAIFTVGQLDDSSRSCFLFLFSLSCVSFTN